VRPDMTSWVLVTPWWRRNAKQRARPSRSRPVLVSHSGVVLFLCATALSFTLSGCNADACSGGEPPRCEGNVTTICDVGEDHSPRWVRNDCGAGFCQLPTQKGEAPFCSETKEPDPRCAPFASLTFFELCKDNKVIGCRFGYIEHSRDCTTGAAFGPNYTDSALSGYCVSEENTAYCALEPTPSSDCKLTEGSYFRACKGDQLLVCKPSLHLVTRKDCPPGTCISTPYPDCR
jgi:hypothetical protein